MPKLSMGMVPGLGGTRVLLVGEQRQTMLKALLPWEPADPQAPRRLVEALAMWCGDKVSAAVSADDAAISFGATAWSEVEEAARTSALCDLRLVLGNSEAQHDGDDEDIHGFEEVRAFMHRWIRP